MNKREIHKGDMYQYDHGDYFLIGDIGPDEMITHIWLDGTGSEYYIGLSDLDVFITDIFREEL